MDIKFTPFWFEGNLFFQTIRDISGFEHLAKNYAETMPAWELFEKAKECLPFTEDSPAHPRSERNFGLRREHDGETTLYAYLKGEGVDVEALIAHMDNYVAKTA